MRHLVLGSAVVLLGAAACGGSPISGPQVGQPSVESLAIGQTPAPGFAVKEDGTLGAETAASATSADPTAATAQLRTDSYQGGWVRAWQSGAEDVELLVLQLGDSFKAHDYVAFQVDQLRTKLGVVPYPDSGVPGATAYVLYGNARVGNRQLFCQGDWYSVGNYAINLTDCADQPRAADLTLRFARQEYVHAAQTLGLPVASPSPEN